MSRNKLLTCLALGGAALWLLSRRTSMKGLGVLPHWGSSQDAIRAYWAPRRQGVIQSLAPHAAELNYLNLKSATYAGLSPRERADMNRIKRLLGYWGQKGRELGWDKA